MQVLSLKSWVSSSQFLSVVFSFSDGLVISSYIWESWWRRIVWQPEGQCDTIRKQDQQGRDNSSEDMVNNSSNFLTVICCVYIYHVLWLTPLYTTLDETPQVEAKFQLTLPLNKCIKDKQLHTAFPTNTCSRC